MTAPTTAPRYEPASGDAVGVKGTVIQGPSHFSVLVRTAGLRLESLPLELGVVAPWLSAEESAAMEAVIEASPSCDRCAGSGTWTDNGKGYPVQRECDLLLCTMQRRLQAIREAQ